MFALVVWMFFACNSKKVFTELARTDKIDQDIILINVGDSKRSEIAELLLSIEQCKPSIIGIDIIFNKDVETSEDSTLIHALQKIDNDILAYVIESGKKVGAQDKVRKYVSDEGYVNIDELDGVSSHFTPMKEINGKLFESFALKIIKKWKPGFKYNLTINKSIPILFQRSQQQYYYFVKEDLLEDDVRDLLTDKIVLVGFLGPGDEAKHFTPIRSDDKEFEGKPDMYGLVIQANAIRTILEHER